MLELSVLFFAAFNASALDLPVKDGDQILLRGGNAQVNYTVVPGATVLKITELSPLSWTAERHESVLLIEGPEPESRAAASSALRTPPARVTIDLQGPSLPLEIHLRDGGVLLSKGAHEARVSLQTGRVVAIGRSGGLRVNGRKTDVNVSDSKGRVDVDVYQGSVTLKNTEGDSDVDLFTGALSADGSRGTLAIETSTAVTKVSKFTGTLQLNLRKGAFSGTGLQGRIEGKTGESPVHLSLLNDTDVNLQSQSGRLQIQTPPGSGASINLVSGGEISVPNGIGVNRGAAEKTARGRLKGDGKMQLTIRSAEGLIVIK